MDPNTLDAPRGRPEAIEERLREIETRHRLFVESWAQAVWKTDAAGVVVADSPSWRAYTGQTLEEWLGYGWLGAVHPDDRAYAERQWRDAMDARRLVDAEFRLRAPDGGWCWTNVHAAPVLGAGGAIEKWVGINIDISAAKEAEAALREKEARYRTLFETMGPTSTTSRACRSPCRSARSWRPWSGSDRPPLLRRRSDPTWGGPLPGAPVQRRIRRTCSASTWVMPDGGDGRGCCSRPYAGP